MVDISLSPIGARVGYWPTVRVVDFASYLRRPSTIPSDSPLDVISLSAAAQQFISTAVTAFPSRTQAIAQLAQANLALFGPLDYSGAAFIGQNLQYAVFNGAILKDVNFASANLQGSKFIASVVDGANFTAADLRGADLRGAQGLIFSQVQGAMFDKSTFFPGQIGTPITGIS